MESWFAQGIHEFMKIPFIRHARARVYSKWNFAREWRALFVLTVVLFLSLFFRGMKHNSKKESECRRVDFYTRHGGEIDERPREWTLCAADRSAGFGERWASGERDSQNCAFARFRSPRLFMEAMQFTDNRAFALRKKNTRARTSPRDDMALIEFLDPRRSAWLFITRAVYLRVIHGTARSRSRSDSREDRWSANSTRAYVMRLREQLRAKRSIRARFLQRRCIPLIEKRKTSASWIGSWNWNSSEMRHASDPRDCLLVPRLSERDASLMFIFPRFSFFLRLSFKASTLDQWMLVFNEVKRRLVEGSIPFSLNRA